VRGVDTVHNITQIANDLGIQYLTLYTFSTENWNRPKAEVDALMNLVVIAIEQQTPELLRNNARLITIGDTQRLPLFARQRLQKCIDDTAHCTGLTLCLALSYSARWEIVEATKKIAAQVEQGNIAIDDIDDNLFANNLSTANIPDPDLLIRTAGDYRISNYMLWQIAYSELYFTNVFWPEFSKEDFLKAIIDYQARERRFGKTSEQLNCNNE
ncbi:MAG: di-trans,poly-cis-decaprenylcistransferase, partial [Muribaculaceae bacterium]|nr:di-trans,poly-cis-decaprenylcistransferase [Muribaculaceae bacterium]